MSMDYRSVFDIIGPIMIGPSSSHTAGAVAIGQVAHKLFETKPKKVFIHYYESFAKTHKGHGTDYAIIAGILGFKTDDLRVPNAIEIAQKEGIEIKFIEEKGNSPIGHPNTAICVLTDDVKTVTVSACSVGGGTIHVKDIEINGINIRPSGPLPILLVESDRQVTGANVSKELNKIDQINNSQTYKSLSNGFIFEYDLENKLKAESLQRLAKYANKIIYL